MSQFSHEHHLLASQDDIIRALEVFWFVNGAGAVDVIDLPQELKTRQLIQKDNEELNFSRYLVGPTDEYGWCMIFSEWDNDDEAMVLFISEELNCLAFYGHNNDSTDNWRWILCEYGRKIDEYWYTGQDWARDTHIKRPPEVMTLYEAFKSRQRKYHHLTFDQILLGGDAYFNVPIVDFKLVAIDITR